ncbi:MAG: RNA methyltransferase, partial [Clostridia bacterium]|nr:RNA methyltransferase [Clostridia bacterium]
VIAPLLAGAERVFEIPDALAAHMGETDTPQGVFAIGQRREVPLTVTPRGRYLALEDVQDPANLGTVIRTAEAMGVEGLLLSAGCCDLYNPKVLRGSMGGVFRLSTLVVPSMPEAVRQWQAAGLTVYACVVDPDAEKLTAITFEDGAVCLIGNEGNGLKPETVAACARRITIPMAGRAESLNASMAAGIVLWELTRGRAPAGEA